MFVDVFRGFLGPYEAQGTVGKEEPAAEAELEAVEMEENSRELLMKAHESWLDGEDLHRSSELCARCLC